MRVLLIMPQLKFIDNWGKTSFNRENPPLGLAYIGSLLKEYGYEVKVFDVMERIDHLNNIITGFQPDIIGISCLTSSYPEFVQAVKKIRLSYSGLLVAGGPHINFEPLKTLQQLPIDVCVIGEGEKTMLELVDVVSRNRMHQISNIEGTISRIKGDIVVAPLREPIADLDSLPFPDWSLFELERYKAKIGNRRMATISSQRGCPYRCCFCSSKNFWGREIRSRSPENVVLEMQLLKKNFGFRAFEFCDDTFVLNAKRVLRICELLKSSDFIWRVTGRINLMTDKLLSSLSDSGCVQLDYGIESGVQKVLNSMSKDISVKKVEEVIGNTVDHNINVHAYFMLSLPGETLNDMKKTVQLAERLYTRYGCTIEFQLTRIYPGTPLAKMANLKIDDWSAIRTPFISYPNVPIYHELQLNEVYNFWLKTRRSFIFPFNTFGLHLLKPKRMVRQFLRKKIISRAR